MSLLKLMRSEYEAYVTFNYHRAFYFEKLQSYLEKEDHRPYPIVLLCGNDGSSRDFFLHSAAYKLRQNQEDVFVYTVDFDGYARENCSLDRFVDYHLEQNQHFTQSSFKKALDHIKTELQIKSGSLLIPFIPFSVKFGFSLKDIRSCFQHDVPQPKQSERETISALLTWARKKGQVIVHIQNAMVNCPEVIELLMQESMRHKVLLCLSCESEEEFKGQFPGETVEVLSFTPYKRSELHEIIDQHYHPNTFDPYFIDLFFRYTQGQPELIAGKMKQIEDGGWLKVDSHQRFCLPEKALRSREFLDLFEGIFKPFESMHGLDKERLDQLLKLGALCGRVFPATLLCQHLGLDENEGDAVIELLDDLSESPVLPLVKDIGFSCPGLNLGRVNFYMFCPYFRTYMLGRMSHEEHKVLARALLSFVEQTLPQNSRPIARIFLELSEYSGIEEQQQYYRNLLRWWVTVEKADQLKSIVAQQLRDHELDPGILLQTIKKAENRLHPLIRLRLLEAYEANPSGVALDKETVILTLKGLLYFRLGNYREAEPLLEQALAIDEQSLGSEHPTVATALNNLAALYQATNRLAEAEPLFDRALMIDETSLGSEHSKVARDLNNLAMLYLVTNRLKEAEPLMKRVVEILENPGGEPLPNYAASLNNLAQLYRDTNRLKEAEPLMQRALAINETSLGSEHPDVATDLNNLAALYQATNRLKEAEPLAKRALAIDEASLGSEHPDVARDLNNLAQLYNATNRLKEAEPLMQRALAIAETSLGSEHPDVAIDLNNLAALYQATNRLKEAEPLAKRALAIDEASLGKNHPKVAIDLNNLALLYQATNRLAEAEPLMERQLVILLQFTRRTGHPHPHLKAAVNSYSALLTQMGHSDDDVNNRLKRLAPEIFDIDG